MSDDFYLTPHSRLGKPQNRTPIQFHWAPAAKGILGSQSLCFHTTNKPPSSSSFYCFSFTEETSVCTPTARDSYERLSLAGQALPPGFPSPFLFPDGLSSIETLLTNIQVLSSDPVWLWPCSLITTCIRRLHLTQLSNVEEKKNHTHTRQIWLFQTAVCTDGPRAARQSVHIRSNGCSLRLWRRFLPVTDKKNADDIVFLANWVNMTFPVCICRTFKAPSARTEPQRCLSGSLCVKWK